MTEGEVNVVENEEGKTMSNVGSADVDVLDFGDDDVVESDCDVMTVD